MTYNIYHTSFKEAIALDMLSQDIKQSIPKSTIYRFQHTDFSKLIRIPAEQDIAEHRDLARDFLQSKHAVTLFRAALYLRDKKIKVMNLIKQQKEKAREIIISAVLKVKQVLSVKRAVRFFGISVKTFYSWKNKIQHKCLDSILSKCVRRWPNQLTSK